MVPLKNLLHGLRLHISATCIELSLLHYIYTQNNMKLHENNENYICIGIEAHALKYLSLLCCMHGITYMKAAS